MNTTAEKITALLQEALQPDILEVIDESDLHIGHAGAKEGKGHFAIEIASKHLVGKSRLESHRLIYQALGELMQTSIHALSINIVKNEANHTNT